jgi:hypothetical protein
MDGTENLVPDPLLQRTKFPVSILVPKISFFQSIIAD